MPLTCEDACEVSKTVNFEENDYSPTPSRLQERSASDVPPLTKPLLEPLVLQSSSTLGKVDIVGDDDADKGKCGTGIGWNGVKATVRSESYKSHVKSVHKLERCAFSKTNGLF